MPVVSEEMVRPVIERALFDFGPVSSAVRGDLATILAKRLTAALSDQVAGWRPIETAPADESLILGWWRDWPDRKWECEIELASCTKGGWRHARATHWRHTPIPPVETGAGAAT